jgi:hypothetical protein
MTFDLNQRLTMYLSNDHVTFDYTVVAIDFTAETVTALDQNGQAFTFSFEFINAMGAVETDAKPQEVPAPKPPTPINDDKPLDLDDIPF